LFCYNVVFFIETGDNEDSLKNIIVTVARYFYFSPFHIDRLFLDNIDHLGLIYWYKDAMEQYQEQKRIEKESQNG
jgi:hypothetical protein